MTEAELRASILQAAVQGKLVPQDPTDEPASVLLERIREERRALVKAKKAKAPKGGESVITRYPDGTVWEQHGKGEAVDITDEVPFDIPEGWKWARFDDVGMIAGGGTPDKSNRDYWGGDIFWASVKDIKGDYLTETIGTITKAGLESKASISECVPGDLIVATRLVPGKSIICQIDCVINQDLKRIRSMLDVDYLHFWFQNERPHFQNLGQGTTVTGIKLDALQTALIPIPPLAEQRRIVAKLDELMPLVERYDRLDRERTELNAGIEGAMRASVLQAAVQGRLTEREDGDEPASELLDRIRKERAELIKQKKAKKPKGGESVITRYPDGTVWEQRGKGKAVDITDEVPFDIPDGWEWSRLEEVGVWKAGSTPLKSNATYYENGSIPWLLVGDLNDGHVGQAHHFITEHAIEECPLQINPAGSVLVAMYMSIGKVGILDIEAATNQAICACQPFIASMSEWVFIYVLSQRNALNEQGAGSTQKNISRAKLVEMLIPVPPLAEQRRIVAKLDELLSKVERLGELAS